MADLTRKTANLAHNNREKGYTLSSSTGLPVQSTSTNTKGWCFMTPIAQVKVGDKIHVHIDNPDNIGFWCGWSIVSDNVKKDSASGRGNNSTITATYDGDFYFVCYVLKADESKLDEMINTLMLNFGTTTLPYEPYGWVHSLRKQCSATETIQSGDTIYANGQPITTYNIKGNEEHTGTPSPQNPVMPQGTGERTANLFDKTDYVAAKYIDSNGIEQISASGNTNHSNYISIKSDTNYTLSTNKPDYREATYAMAWYDSNKTFIKRDSWPNVSQSAGRYNFTATSPNNAAYAIFNFVLYPDFNNEQIVFNEGSAIDYEPYGYKIPISTHQGSAVNYLGSVQSTRQIGKCILTGNEDYSRYDADRHVFRVTNTSAGVSRLSGTSGFCTHFERIGSQADLTDGQFSFGSSYIYFRIDSITYNPDFIAYIQGQYANGTPVIVWYVLDTDTTGITNEPLYGIGDYVDSISNATAIPTVDGTNTITVDTTVQPSEFSATWTGWHNAEVKEKSENLFDITQAIHNKQYNTQGELIDARETGDWYASNYIPVQYGHTYIRSSNGVAAGNVVNTYNSNYEFIGRLTPGTGIPFGITNLNVKYITFAINSNNTPISTYMFNEGETALPYEPYWK